MAVNRIAASRSTTGAGAGETGGAPGPRVEPFERLAFELHRHRAVGLAEQDAGDHPGTAQAAGLLAEHAARADGDLQVHRSDLILDLGARACRTKVKRFRCGSAWYQRT